MIANLGRGY